MLLDAVLGVLVVLDQTHGELVLLEEVRVGVVLGLCNSATEGSESVLGDDARVGEPLAVGLDASNRCIAGLVRGGLCDVATGVALGLAVLEHVERLDLLGISVEQGGLVSILVLVMSNPPTSWPEDGDGIGIHTCRSSRP